MKNKLLSCLIVVFCVSIFSFTAFAYDVPDNSYYIEADTNIGDVVLLVPYNYGKYLSLQGDTLVGQYSSNITMYGNSDRGGFQVRVPPFQSAEYRYDSNNSYTWSDFQVYSIIDSNVPFLQSTDFTLFSQSNLVNMLMVLVGGTIIVLLLKKR